VVFGQPLKLLASRNLDVGDLVPKILRSSFHYLDNSEYLSEEGIFRKTGNIPLLNKLIDEWDNGKEPALSEFSEPHVITSLVKRWLGRLPDPLVPFFLYETFMVVAQVNDVEATTTAVVDLLKQLPLHHIASLKFVVDFLYKTTKYEKKKSHGDRKFSNCNRS